jgi:hypothetical protein
MGGVRGVGSNCIKPRYSGRVSLVRDAHRASCIEGLARHISPPNEGSNRCQHGAP